MTDSTPLTLEQLPLFPLNTVLFPGGKLPLRIFEVRYLDMVQRCRDAGAPFGVVCLTRGNEVATAEASLDPAAPPEAFQTVGTLARLESCTQPQPGLLQIVCEGTQRFRVQSTAKLRHGLWVGNVTLLPPDLPVPVPDELGHPVRSLQRLVHALTVQAGDPAHLPEQFPLRQPYQWNDAGWVANRWCELLPVSNELKQRLMSLDNPLVRLELVGDLLDKLRLDTER